MQNNSCQIALLSLKTETESLKPYTVLSFDLQSGVKNKPERVFGLQVRCKELDIFKILGIFGDS